MTEVPLDSFVESEDAVTLDPRVLVELTRSRGPALALSGCT